MASIANIVLNNGEVAPVAKTFSPTDCTTAMAVWHDRSLGIDIGSPQLTLSLKKLKSVNEVKIEISVPTLEVISGSDGGYTPAPRVAYTNVGRMTYLLPVRSSLQERKNLAAFMKNACSNAFIVSAIENLERAY